MRKLLSLIIAVLTLSNLFTGTVLAETQSVANLKPVASLSVNPTAGWVGLPFSFDASASRDSRGQTSSLEYRFNFNPGEYEMTPWRHQAKITNTYKTPGNKNVILEVRDIDGMIDRTTTFLTVAEEPRFGAVLDVSPHSGSMDTAFQFKVSITKTVSSMSDDYLVRYDFEGDGRFDTAFSQQKLIYHSYNDPGVKVPTIEIKNKTGEIIKMRGFTQSGGELGEITVSDSELPRAALSVVPTVGFTESTFYIDASGSFDQKNNRNLEYRFDFEDDGIFDTEFSSSKQTQHNYSTPGVKTMVVEVKDSDGLTDRTKAQVLIRDRDLKPTDLRISVQRPSTMTSSGTQIQGTLSNNFRLSVNGRDDRDSSGKLRYRWDFDSDGNFDTTYSSLRTVNHRYTEPGQKKVTVEAIDTAGNKSTTTTTLNVVSNTPPKAVIKTDYLVGTTATVFTFSSATTDSQQRISSLEFRFDFNNDGQYDTPFKRNRQIRYSFKTPGIKTVVMQVRDPEGATSIATQQVEILRNSKPLARLTISPNSGDFTTRFTLDGSFSDDGQTAKKDLKFRFDSDYTGADDVSYDSGFTRAPIKKLTFRDKTGERRVRLEVMDENGEITTAFGTINIHWAAPYMDFLRRKSVMSGYRGGNMQPDQSVTRAELTTMILKAKKTTFSGYKFAGTFSDVKRRDWFSKYIEKAEQLNIASGFSDGSFRPNNSITRGEAVSMIMRAFPEKTGTQGKSKTFRDVPATSPYFNVIDKATALGLIDGYGDGTFRPNQTLKRGEAAKILTLALEKIERQKL